MTLPENTAKNIIITGSSSGLGAAMAIEYAAPGIILGLIGRHQERLENIADQCRNKGATVMTALLDITDSTSLGIWIKEFDQNHPIDLCIANAGISAGTGGVGESLEQIQRIFNVNLNGVINTIYPVIEEMQKRGKGQIGIVSSIAGFRGSPTAPAYSASKAAVRYYGQALQGAFGSKGIDISVICPGFIKTPMTDVNPFPMPFIMIAEKAAKIVKVGLLKRKKLIAFPWPMVFLARLQNLLPDALINKLYQSVPSKPSNSI